MPGGALENREDKGEEANGSDVPGTAVDTDLLALSSRLLLTPGGCLAICEAASSSPLPVLWSDHNGYGLMLLRL